MNNYPPFLSLFHGIEVRKFESTIELTEVKPYVDYFDNLRTYFTPFPSDEEWRNVLNKIQKQTAEEITTNGKFTDKNVIGFVIARK